MIELLWQGFIANIELFTTIVLALCVFLCARNNIWNWPVGLVGISMYGLSAYFLWGLYADAYLQIFYFLTGVYGWWYWAKGYNKTNAPIRSLTDTQFVAIACTIGGLTIILAQFLIRSTDSVVPWLDAFTTVTCLFAQLLMMRRIKQNWILWIVADVVYIYMFYVKGLNYLSVEYALFTANAAYGYYNWNKLQKEQAVCKDSCCTA